MTLQLIDKKKKIFFFIFLLFFLSNIDNLNLIKNRSNFQKIKIIEVNGLEKSLNLKIQKDFLFLKNKNIFLFNKKKMKNELNEYDFIERYYVNKIFPSKLVINLQPAKFIATTFKENNKYFIGTNKRFINSKNFNKNYNIPNIFGNFSIKEFFILKSIIDDSGFDYQSIENFFYFPNGRWDIKNKNGITIKLPSKKIEESLFKAKLIIENNQLSSYNIIDLRIQNQVILVNG